jgi:hypothetical protein
MGRLSRWPLAACTVLSAFLVLVGQQTYTPSGVFNADTAMQSPRDGASAAVLTDGRILITGGNDANSNALASAEFLGSGSSAGQMATPRSAHVSVTLKDGHVLVAGGRTTRGAVTSVAEIYDPSTGTWTTISSMLAARAGATATLLNDGRVLIAGGQGSGSALQTVEIFDPTAGTFNNAAPMSTARQNQAAALLRDGRVVIAGGSTDSMILNTIEIYDPGADTVSTVAPLATARQGLTATTLLDGRVLLSGGNDGSNDLKTTEILDVAAGTINAGPNMSTARRGHLAWLLPNNNTVLFVSGTAASPAAELFIPWQNQFAVFGNLANPRINAAGGASVTGSASVAGGQVSGTASNLVETVHFPMVKTDKPDYQPGDTVTITGSGFRAGETVAISIVEDPDLDADSPIQFNLTADANGSFTDSHFEIDLADLGTYFTLTATGNTSGLTAQMTFTDSKSLTVAFSGTGSGSVTSIGGSGSITCTDTAGSSSGTCSNSFGNTDTVTLTEAPSPPSTFGGWTVVGGATITSGTCTSTSTTCTFNLNNNAITVTARFNPGTATKYVVTSSSSVPVAGSAVTITAQLTDSGGNPVHTSGKVITWSSTNGGSFSAGTSTTDSNGVATVSFTTSTIASTVHTVTATDNTTPTHLTGTSGSITTQPGLGSATNSTVSASPTSVVADGSTTSTITVTLKDSNNNLVSGKTVTLAKNGGSSTISAASGPSDTNGVVTFTVSDTVAESTIYTATDTTDSRTITQTATVTFTPGLLDHFKVEKSGGGPIGTQTAGTAFNIQITAQDLNNNTVTSFTSTVSLTSNGALTGSPVTTVAFTNGVLNPQSVTITSSGSAVTITATGSGKTGTSASFVVNGASATTLVVSGYPSSTTAGASHNFTVTAKDQFGNIAGGYRGTVTFTSSDSQAALPADRTFTSGDNGVHTFSATLKTGGTQSLTATDTVTSSLTASQTGIVVSAALASKLNFTSSPFSVQAGTCSPQITLATTDAFGNPANVAGDTTVNLSSTSAVARYYANATDCANGTNNVTRVSITGGSQTTSFFYNDTRADGPVITASATNFTSAMQTETITVGPFTKLQLLVPGETAAPGTASGKTGTPTTEFVGGAFNVTVNAVDAFWNLISAADTVQITSSDANALLPANAPLSAGTGTFSVTLETAGTSTIITASDITDSNKTPSTSPPITVIVVYTASISPTTVAPGNPVRYTLTVNNAPSPNTDTIGSVIVAIPAGVVVDTSSSCGTSPCVTVTATNPGQPGQPPAVATWVVDTIDSSTMHFRRCMQNGSLPGDGCSNPGSNNISPGGTIVIGFTATAPTTGSKEWTTTAYSNPNYTPALPLAGPEPTVTVGVPAAITSADHATFTVGTAGTFTVTATGTPTPSLSETGSLPGGVTFVDNGNGTATLSGTPTAGGSFALTITAHNGVGTDAVQTFTLNVSVPITVTTSPANLQISVDGGVSQTAPQTFTWAAGSSHTIATSSPQNGASGQQFVWTSWSDAGTISHAITVPSTAATYTASFKTQYQVTFKQTGVSSDAGTNTVLSIGATNYNQSQFDVTQWVDTGTGIAYSYAPTVTTSDPGKQYVLTSTTPSTLSSVTAPTTVTGSYKTQYKVTFMQTGIGSDTSTNTVLSLTVNSTTTTYDASHLPSAWYDAGTNLSYSYSSPVATSPPLGKQYALTSGSPNPSPASPINNLGAAATVTGAYKTQYQVTFKQTGVSGDAGTNTVLSVGATNYNQSQFDVTQWVDNNGSISFTWAPTAATSTTGKQYAFVSSSQASPLTVTAAVTVTGTYKTQWQVTFAQSGISSDTGTNTILSIGASNYNYGQFNAMQWVDDGGSISFTWAPTVATSNTGKQYAFVSSSASSPQTINAAITITGTYKTQWQVTFGQSGMSGDQTGTIVTVGVTAQSVLPYSQWVDNNGSISFTWAPAVATSNTAKQYAFVSSSASSPQTITTAMTITGTYKTQWQVTFIQSGISSDAGANPILTLAGPTIYNFSQFNVTQWVDNNGSISFTWAPTVATSTTGKQYAFVSSSASSPLGGITSPQSVTGTYKTQYQVTFTQTGIGGDTGTNQVLSRSVNAGAASLYNASNLPPATWYDAGTSFAYTYSSPVAASSDPNKQYVLTSTTPTSPISSLSAPTTVTGAYKTQFRVTFTQTGIGVDTGSNTVLTLTVGVGSPASYDAGHLTTPSTWYDSGTNLTYSYSSPVASTTAGKQYALTNNPGTSYTVNASQTISGAYKTQWQVTFAQTGISTDAGSNTIVTINGTPHAIAAPLVTDWFDAGVPLTYSYASPVATSISGKRYVITNTPIPASGFSPSTPVTVTATYQTQFYLAITTSPGTVPRTSVTPADGWYYSGMVPSLSAALSYTSGGGTGYTFKNWTVDVTSSNTSDPLSVTMNQAHTIVANYTTWGLAWVASQPSSVQYSDRMGLSAVLTADGIAISGKTINFGVGTDVGSGTTDATGTAATPNTAVLTQSPGSYTANATCSVLQCGVLLTISYSPYQITQEDARATYTGALFASTGSTTSTTARVTLAATVQDITAVLGDPAYDLYPGDIRKATLTFVNRDAANAILCTAPIGLVSASDTKTGTGTCDITVTVPSAGYTTFAVGIVIGGYYIDNSSGEDGVVNVSQPGTNFITGGGYLLINSVSPTSAGLAAGGPGTKNNFGFNVKYNKQGTNLQGNINTIIRSTLGPLSGCPVQAGGVYVYQVKGNSMTSLAVNTNSTGGTATFNGKASIQDITNPNVMPCSVDGNATLQVDMTDNGSGSGAPPDTIDITVWNKAGGLWFSSTWDGTKTIQQNLTGGNLQVH